MELEMCISVMDIHVIPWLNISDGKHFLPDRVMIEYLLPGI